MQWRGIIGGLVLGISTQGYAAPASDNPYVDHHKKIAVVGDSLSVPLSWTWPEQLEQMCNGYTVTSHAKGGWPTGPMRKNLKGFLSTDEYTDVIILAGTNDINNSLGSDSRKGDPMEKTKQNLSAMYKTAHDAGLVVHAMTVLPLHEHYKTKGIQEEVYAKVEKLNAWIRAQEGVYVDEVIDANKAFACSSGPACTKGGIDLSNFWNDHLHPSRKGHRRLAQYVQTQAFPGCEIQQDTESKK